MYANEPHELGGSGNGFILTWWVQVQESRVQNTLSWILALDSRLDPILEFGSSNWAEEFLKPILPRTWHEFNCATLRYYAGVIRLLFSIKHLYLIVVGLSED